jgi:hypothetical protein
VVFGCSEFFFGELTALFLPTSVSFGSFSAAGVLFCLFGLVRLLLVSRAEGWLVGGATVVVVGACLVAGGVLQVCFVFLFVMLFRLGC